jgi:hypothetical protein
MSTLSPRHIKKDESLRLGIEEGWYGIKVNGTLMTGVCASREECLKQISTLPAPPARA